MAKIVYQRTYKALNEVGAKAVARLRQLMKQQKVDASGATSASLSHNVEVDGDLLVMGLSGRQKGKHQIISIIDRGRRNGKYVPIDPIERWINDKGIKIRDSRGRYAKRTPQNIRRAAFGISAGIMKRGIPSNPLYDNRNILDRAFSSRRKEFEEKILTALGQDIDEQIDNNMPKQNRKR